jgi:hypothetical protein
MRKALIVGIDHYEHFSPLHGCVQDAREVQRVLGHHGVQEKVNFKQPRVLLGTHGRPVPREDLKRELRELFSGKSEIALFYFAGHGHVEDTGGYICASDCRTGDDGVPLSEVVTLAAKSKATNKVIVLDSCYSGILGQRPDFPAMAEVSEGMTILTASTDKQYAEETNGGGVFTSLFVDALDGAAANLLGNVTPGAVYAHIDQSLGPWKQRPVFRTNIEQFVSLREVEPPISLADLKRLTTFFPGTQSEMMLDPSFEPERTPEQNSDPTIPPPDPKNMEIFAVLQRYVRVNLLRPYGAEHMWHAAWNRKSCKLTTLGRHYRDLVAEDLI